MNIRFHKGRPQKAGRRTVFYLPFSPIFIILTLMASVQVLDASHFRYGHASWKLVGPRTVEFQIDTGWRSTFIGSYSWRFGDGTSHFVSASSGTTIGSGSGFITKRNTVRHTYAHNGPFTAFFEDCCRIGGIANASGWFKVSTIVDLRNGNQGSPVSAIPVIVQMARLGTNSVQLSAGDPQLDSLSWSLATIAGAGGSYSPPSGMTLSSSGLLQWNPAAAGASVNSLYTVRVRIDENRSAAASEVDFFIQVVDGTANRPPTCRLNGPGSIVARVGQFVSLSLTGSDPEGRSLRVESVGLPPGASLSPLSGSSPLTTTFRWTPTPADRGTSSVIAVTFRDSVGLTTTCSFSVTVPSNQPPSANAGPDQVVNAGANCQGDVTLSGSGSDPENQPLTYQWSGPFLGGNPPAGPVANVTLPIGTHTATLLVTDDQGATASDTVTIVVEDNENPVVLTQNITVQLDANGSANIIPAQVDAGSSDNCGIASMSVSPNTFTCADVGAGGSNYTQPLHFTCSDGFIVTVSPQQNISALSFGSGFQDIAHGHGNIRTYSIDLHNPVTGQWITVHTVSAETFNYNNFATTFPTVPHVDLVRFRVDSPVSCAFHFNNLPLTLTSSGNVVVLTVTDIHGNVGSATATVTIEDNLAPTVSAQDITIQLDPSGSASISPADVDAGSSDNCGISSMSVSPNTFSCADVGPNGVTLAVTDVHGNTASALAMVTVEDNIAPQVFTQDITISLDENGHASITPSDIDAGSSDTCGIGSMVVSPDTFICANVGPNDVTLTVTDVNGTAASAGATVTVLDVTPPEITCPEDLILECDGLGNTEAIADWLASFAAEDTCGIASLENDFEANGGLSDGCGATGSATVNFTATDVNGNESTCSSTVTVVDDTPPSLSSDVHDIYPSDAPITFTVSTDDICSDVDLVLTYDCHAINGAGNEISRLDGCDVEIVGDQVTIHESGGVGTIITISATATDDCENETSNDFIVNVLRPANEGVGNGEDADTPGHEHNGGNDGSGTGPGDPGAKSD